MSYEAQLIKIYHPPVMWGLSNSIFIYTLNEYLICFLRSKNLIQFYNAEKRSVKTGGDTCIL